MRPWIKKHEDSLFFWGLALSVAALIGTVAYYSHQHSRVTEVSETELVVREVRVVGGFIAGDEGDSGLAGAAVGAHLYGALGAAAGAALTASPATESSVQLEACSLMFTDGTSTTWTGRDNDNVRVCAMLRSQDRVVLTSYQQFGFSHWRVRRADSR